ncbi:unnamed protein product [Acanthoscelides obtectus]|nr:unnamed protein product [Acanthoscelides obtectus]CAK1627723.1 hypothetical protein AOBTE_LOCUS4790 [Acanthoscelides obtectus]
MNKTPASAGGRTICATSCKASCNMSRNSTIANRSVAQPPPSYQSFKTPQNKTSAQMYSTRKEQLSSTLLPGYEPVATEPTIIAGNTSMSKPCGPNISAYHSVSKSCCQKSSFVNATATSARRL